MAEATWCGVSWREAGAARRRRLAGRPVPDGVVRLVTCARVAWLGLGPAVREDVLREAEAMRSLVGTVEIHHGPAAIARFLSVAGGLDSAVQGERQVGAQARTALVGGGRDPVFRLLDHVLARLLARGRDEGWQRANASVASIAVRRLAPTERMHVGVVGDGEMARLAVKHLGLAGVEVVVFNRTPRTGVAPLSAISPQDGWIVATAAPNGWLRRPPGGACIDLGQPPQVLGGDVVQLDTLLREEGLSLPVDRLELAKLAVEEATVELTERLARRTGVPICGPLP